MKGDKNMTYKVIQWYTGDIAKRQVRYMYRRDDIEIVGAVAHHPEKEGLDIGELAGVGSLGVAIGTDVERALSIEADCVLFNSLIWDPGLVAQILRSGKNVLTTRGGWYPKHEDEYALLESAAREGGTSLMGTGNMPGLINDALPLFMGGFTRDVTKIATWQSSSPVLYGTSAVTQQLGIGQPESEMADPGNAVVVPVYDEYFRQSAHLVAEKFGLLLDEFRLTEWRVGLAPTDVHLEALDYTIEKDTVAGFQIGFTGYVGGRPWYSHTVQHTWCFGIGEGWRDAEDEPEWIVTLDGTPSLRIQLETTGGPDPWKSNNVLDLNAARMVNLIPAICKAPAGCQTAFDQAMHCPQGVVL